MPGHNYRFPFEATVDSISFVSILSCLCRSHFYHKGATGYFWWAVCHTSPPSLSLSLCSCGATARAQARTQPLQATTSQIWRDEAHVATDKPLWSISWMHSESVERKALKIKLCPRCAQQWLCGQWSQRQPANIKELGAAGLSVLNTN